MSRGDHIDPTSARLCPACKAAEVPAGRLFCAACWACVPEELQARLDELSAAFNGGTRAARQSWLFVAVQALRIARKARAIAAVEVTT